MDENLKKEVDALTGNGPTEPSAPKGKYLRTFGTDSAALEAGRQPDFTQSDEETVFEEDRPGIIPTTPSITAPAERLVQGSAIDEIPKPAPEPLTITKPEALVVDQNLPTPLHTYKTDFADRLNQTNASAVTILAAEEDQTKVPPLPQKKSSNLGLIISASILVVIGIGAAIFAYEYTRPSALTLAPGVSTPIFIDDTQTVAGSGAQLAQNIELSASKALTTNGIRLLAPAATTTNDVFLALNLPAPAIFLRNVVVGTGMAGVVNVNGTQSPFFIIGTASYGDTFAGLLQWEPTMPRDFATLFPAYPAPANATTTPVARVFPTPTPASLFSDEVVANHDTRVYKDAEGRSIMIYGYWNQNTLIIARDENAFGAIIARLANSETTQ